MLLPLGMMGFFRTGVDSRCGALVGVFGCDCLLSSILSLSFLPLLLLLMAAEVETGGFFSPGDPRLLLLPVVVVVVVVVVAAGPPATAAWLLLSTSLEIIPPVFAAVLIPVAPDDRCRFGVCRLLFKLAPEPELWLALLLLLMLFKLLAELD